MTEAPIFVHAPHPTAQFIVETDASLQVTGAVLYQSPLPELKQEIAYSSHKLQPSEKLYPPHEREMLAVVKALNEWRHYLLGHTFDLYSDNEAVTYFLKQPSLTPRQARWVQLFSEYDFNLYHLPGKDNFEADALSRRPDHVIANDNPSLSVLKLQCSRTLQDTVNNLTFCACRTKVHPYLPCTL